MQNIFHQYNKCYIPLFCVFTAILFVKHINLYKHQLYIFVF